ncbi:MAG TPA: response regulator transcription factor [Pseudonocardiaceae bacterium]|jgi:two-component system nitrate/nitrite response regulator NarL|nr:response regulator transcription factor [Pseudonocardiaceae bacterium]
MNVRRLLLVDDHLMLTEALAARLTGADDLWVAGRCTTDDPHLFELTRQLRPDVLTIEVQPLGSAVEDVLRKLFEAWPAVNIVALSAEHDVERAVSAARAGVAAWVPKECGADQLAEVLRGVCQGHSWYPPELLGPVLRELRADVRQAADRTGPLDVLSPRELDVLSSMVEGRHGRQVAEHLSISIDTVRAHTRSILTKLGVHSRLEAVRVARAAGMRPPEQPADLPVQAMSLVAPSFDRRCAR